MKWTFKGWKQEGDFIAISRLRLSGWNTHRWDIIAADICFSCFWRPRRTTLWCGKFISRWAVFLSCRWQCFAISSHGRQQGAAHLWVSSYKDPNFITRTKFTCPNLTPSPLNTLYSKTITLGFQNEALRRLWFSPQHGGIASIHSNDSNTKGVGCF